MVVDRPPSNQQPEDKEEGRVTINPGRITKEIHDWENTLVARAHAQAKHGESFVNTGFFEVDTGIYTIVYWNDEKDHSKDGKFTVDSEDFAAPGPDDPSSVGDGGGGSSSVFTESTAIFGSIYKDHVIRGQHRQGQPESGGPPDSGACRHLPSVGGIPVISLGPRTWS